MNRRDAIKLRAAAPVRRAAMNYERARKICDEIAADMARDAAAFDGKAFNGRTVAEYLGNQGAAIAALAKIVEQLIALQQFEVQS